MHRTSNPTLNIGLATSYSVIFPVLVETIAWWENVSLSWSLQDHCPWLCSPVPVALAAATLSTGGPRTSPGWKGRQCKV